MFTNLAFFMGEKSHDIRQRPGNGISPNDRPNWSHPHPAGILQTPVARITLKSLKMQRDQVQINQQIQWEQILPVPLTLVSESQNSDYHRLSMILHDYLLSKGAHTILHLGQFSTTYAVLRSPDPVPLRSPDPWLWPHSKWHTGSPQTVSQSGGGPRRSRDREDRQRQPLKNFGYPPT